MRRAPADDAQVQRGINQAGRATGKAVSMGLLRPPRRGTDFGIAGDSARIGPPTVLAMRASAGAPMELARPRLREVGMSKAPSLVDERRAEAPGARVGEAIAEIEIDGMTDRFAIVCARLERPPANLGVITNSSASRSSTKASIACCARRRSSGDASDVLRSFRRCLLTRQCDRGLELHQRRDEQPSLDLSQSLFDFLAAELAAENCDHCGCVDERQASPDISSV